MPVSLAFRVFWEAFMKKQILMFRDMLVICIEIFKSANDM